MDALKFQYNEHSCSRDCSVKYHHANCAHTIAELEAQVAHKDKVISQIETEMSFYTEESSTARYMLRFIAEAKAKEAE